MYPFRLWTPNYSHHSPQTEASAASHATAFIRCCEDDVHRGARPAPSRPAAGRFRSAFRRKSASRLRDPVPPKAQQAEARRMRA
ncbi:hypothetical protein PsYK624_089720 [Phanerochaete sordida]|uniref:Uncharacterized protein n=1 Tax=Phanerochaete sordida TaxID=48140 RepID=A0A9P3LF05_9APHY|nr:hypothetical protein PsYK624_089720 [Phanerochaete sordida]